MGELGLRVLAFVVENPIKVKILTNIKGGA